MLAAMTRYACRSDGLCPGRWVGVIGWKKRPNRGEATRIFPRRCGNSRKKDHVSKGTKLLQRGAASSSRWVEMRLER